MSTLRNDEGQATIEAAYTTIVTFLMITILVQPAIWLYTRTVVGSAAAETARLVATQPPGYDKDLVKQFAIRRLQAIPPVAYFKTEGVQDWVVDQQGNANSDWASVTITVHQEPLPLVKLFTSGMQGQITQKISAKVPAFPTEQADSPSAWTDWMDFAKTKDVTKDPPK